MQALVVGVEAFVGIICKSGGSGASLLGPYVTLEACIDNSLQDLGFKPFFHLFGKPGFH